METTRNVSVEIEINKDGEKYYTKFTVEEASELERISIIEGIFKTLKVDLNINSNTEDTEDNNLENAYKSFLNELDKQTKDEDDSKTEQTFNVEVIDKSFTKQNPILDMSSNKPEHYITGIKKAPLGELLYQCRFHCTNCSTRKTFYIKETDRIIHCRECRKIHLVRQAKKEYLQADNNKNFFIAGNVVGEDEKVKGSS